MSALHDGVMETMRIWTPMLQIGLVGSLVWMVASLAATKDESVSIVKDGELVNWPIEID